MDIGYKWETEIRKRCSDQGIDIGDVYILFNCGGTCYFCGSLIEGISESKDEKWVCIPVLDEEASEIHEGDFYKPQCFHVSLKFSTYLSDGNMRVLTDVWCLDR